VSPAKSKSLAQRLVEMKHVLHRVAVESVDLDASVGVIVCTSTALMLRGRPVTSTLASI
jgi:hypothetical protein